MVGNIGTIGSTNGRTLDGIGIPMLALVEPRTYALFGTELLKHKSKGFYLLGFFNKALVRVVADDI